MGDQLRLFRLTAQEVEIKARQLADSYKHLQSLKPKLKEAQERLRESKEAIEVKELKDEINAARETANKLLADLGEESIPETPAGYGVSVTLESSGHSVTIGGGMVDAIKRGAKHLREAAE